MDRVMNGQGDCCIYPDNIIFSNPTCSRSLWSQHTKINCSSWIAVEKVVQAIKGIVSGMLYGSLKYIVILGALNYGNSSESSWLFTSSQRIHTFSSNLQNKTIPSQAHYVQPRISNPPFSSGLKPTLLMTAISFYFLYFVCRGSYVHMYVCGHTCVKCTYEDQKTICWSNSPSVMWFPGIELRSLDLAPPDWLPSYFIGQ